MLCGTTYLNHLEPGRIFKNPVPHFRRIDGFEYCDLGISRATEGLAHAQLVRPLLVMQSIASSHKVDFHFIFLLSGTMKIKCNDHQSHSLKSGDSIVLPSEISHSFSKCSKDLEFLEVILPVN